MLAPAARGAQLGRRRPNLLHEVQLILQFQRLVAHDELLPAEYVLSVLAATDAACCASTLALPFFALHEQTEDVDGPSPQDLIDGPSVGVGRRPRAGEGAPGLHAALLPIPAAHPLQRRPDEVPQGGVAR